MSKTLVWPAGREDDAVAQYRLLLPAQALKEQGADIEVTRAGPKVIWNRNWDGLPHPPPDARILGLAERPDCDTIVMQRPLQRWWAEVIPMLQGADIRVVVDVDDDFQAVSKDHSGYKRFDPNEVGWHNWEWVAQACKAADLVTCSTPSLLKRYGFGHGMVIPNYVPSRYLRVEPIFKREQTAGWTGTVHSHPGDLQSARGAIGEVLNDFGWHFHVLGLSIGVQAALGLREEPSEMVWVPFAEYPARMAEVELGVVPLADTRFNQGKSALKMMEYGALGIPVLASATEDNLRMAQAGVGLTVKRPHHWRKMLKRLLESPEYRAEIAGSSRERMASFTYEKNAWRWAFAWRLDQERIHNLGAAAS